MKARYELVVEYEVLTEEGDEPVPPEDIAADALYSGVHNYYLVEVRAHGPEVTNNDGTPNG